MISFTKFTPIIANKHLFKPIDIVLNPCQCYILKGKNGIGKSTMLRICANIYHEYAGEYQPQYDSTDYHYITNNIRFNDHTRCDEIIELWAKIYHGDGHIDHHIFDKTLLTQKYGQLSNGQKQHLLLTKLLFINRKIWLLDEMDSAIDQQTRQQFAMMINQHTQMGGMVLMASHGNHHDMINNAHSIHLESL